ncbi:MAG: WecB/TagA/CpsF family glycosyltransferase [Bacteroidales bacterium]|jgi:UDP-N-acetyl-D-mannosaminouronate:lipid I N-acetyl-D-mannosaminouronosyltransferase|nr:WecB/TagA/CpsF family glycosyltransferase [Bacteroidales bacterium]
MKKISVNGIDIYPFSDKSEVIRFVNDNEKGILIAINAEKILHSTEDMRKIINRSIGYCDGIGAVMALQKKGYKNVRKIPGCELWIDIVKAFYKQKTFYLIGGQQGIIESTVTKLKYTFEGINIIGYRNGYIESDVEKENLISDITDKKPDIVFVAMGSPKQEFLMDELYNRYPAIYQGLGGSFDVFTGYAKRAPKWWIEHRLEFAYRLIKQPSRIKRQIHLIKFWFMIQLERF